MSITEAPFSFGIPTDYPCPINGQQSNYAENNGCIFRGYQFFDPDVVGDGMSGIKGFVLYFHGSGAGKPKRSILSDTLNEAGYFFIAVNELGNGISGASPHKYSYGNVNDPEFTQRWIMTAWYVRSVVQCFLESINTFNIPVVLLGHSMGAAGVLGYLANYTGEFLGLDTGFYELPAVSEHINLLGTNYKGCIVNGATIAGLGNNTWNDINSNINQMSQMMRLAQYAPAPKIITYADNDAYAPPDYVQYLKASLDFTNDNTYVLSAGDRGHSWFNDDTASAEQVLDWVNQLVLGTAIKSIDGSVAKSVSEGGASF